MSDDDPNPRPAKRQRMEFLPPVAQNRSLTTLPAPVLLLALPDLFAHPPTDAHHPRSIHLSIQSLRKCLSLNSLSPEVECRAWTALAEIGMVVIDGGMSQNIECPWAHGIEQEVEKAISKGLLIAQKHPSLRLYKYQLMLTQARVSHWQRNSKFARTLLRRLIASFQPSDPPSVIYASHIALIHLLLDTKDLKNALEAVKALQRLASQSGHSQVTLLAHAIHLHVLSSNSHYQDIKESLDASECALGLSYASSKDGGQSFIAFTDPIEALLAIHILILSVTYYTHIGSSSAVSPRLSHLHALLDSGALDKFPEGIVDIPLSPGPPLLVRTTHPRTLFYLGFLISSIAKRDAMGRKPKRKVFATEGIAIFDRPEAAPALSCPKWASRGDVEEVEEHLDRIKADLISELVAVSIMRSEFDIAEENLALLIAHTRSTNLFSLYAPRLTLHHAHLAHALGQPERAMTCYRIAAHLADEGGSTAERDYVACAARAGEVGLRIGLYRASSATSDDEWAGIVELGRAAADACRGMGGALEAVGEVLRACLGGDSILQSKVHLKAALELATQAQDNHLRALVLALIAAHYFHTAGGHALSMLGTCEQLAAGLGAPPAKEDAGKDQHGNVPLRLWLGERFVELYKRAGKEERAEQQSAQNAELRRVVERLAIRGQAAVA
ncbi:hypothetical protein BV25DRAFT_1849368 [Artomyces pyxidatus]|uniref:Uncharacterized protein n=1 Tax=Artomyces pyxidatus TaxID=48021 RepID=A0ACB8TEB1_9AGAM|nr:hypothetical protein BV25DRAFT_1849368 [Artomyces pyxidatus]